MLKKLLKYDFKSVFKYWWIAAASSVVLSVLGGFCITIINDASPANANSIQPPEVLVVLATLLLILSIIGMVAFSLTSMILVYVRFYKNFFTDEGYLTFTLPVKRTHHLNSKLILSTVTEFATLLLIGFDVLLMLTIGFADKIFNQKFWEGFVTVVKELLSVANVYTVIYIIEILILLALTMVFSCLFTYACITFASMITKKAKVITAIGIYYVANGFFSFVVQIFYLFGITSLVTHFAQLPENMIEPVVALLGVGILLFITLFCAILYTFEYWMLDRKLNLA